ncbi:MAG: ATP-binding protein [Cyanobacteria bacterium P01_E01_bin.6]
MMNLNGSEIINQAQSFHSFSKNTKQLLFSNKFLDLAEIRKTLVISPSVTKGVLTWQSLRNGSNFPETTLTLKNLEQQAEDHVFQQTQLAKVGKFSAMMVHELRNPLTTVLMGLSHCKSLELSPTSQEVLDLALDEGKRLKTLLSSILNYAKPQRLCLEQVELNGLVNGVLNGLASQPVAADRQLRLYPEEKAILAQVDPDKFKQILINLVSNACEAISPGDIVSCRILRTASGVSIQIQNSAPPIPSDVLEKLTDPFYSTKPDGTGLGLAIVKQLVEAHQGNFIIESNAKVGFHACIQLPAFRIK